MGTPFQMTAWNFQLNSQKGGSGNCKKEGVMLKGEKKFSRGMLVLYMS